MKRLRRNHSAKFKALVALENLETIFGAEVSSGEDRDKIRELHAKIGELSVERDFLSGALGKYPGLSAPIQALATN